MVSAVLVPATVVQASDAAPVTTGAVSRHAVSTPQQQARVIPHVLQAQRTKPRAKVLRLRPAHGPTIGGTKVIIEGTNLPRLASVRFGKILADSVLSKSSTKLVAIAPTTLTAGKVSVRVKNKRKTEWSRPGPGARYTYKKLAAAQWSMVATANDRSCGVQTNHTLWCWGQIGFGKRGNTLVTRSRVFPWQIGRSWAWASVSLGGANAACGLHTDRSLWCWGDGDEGQLGTGSTKFQDKPVRVPGPSNWAMVSTGYGHSCGVRTDHTLWCWGSNTEGTLGDGTTTNRLRPTQVGSDHDWSTAAAGSAHTCGIRTDHTLWCWGWNGSGQLGNPAAGRSATTPVQVGTAADWTSVSLSNSDNLGYTCGTRADGSLWCWGSDRDGQLGVGSKGPDRETPVPVGTGSQWSSVTVDKLSCALRVDHSLWCWGDGGGRGIGDGSAADRLLPTRVVGPADWTGVSTGGWAHRCGVRSDHSAWCWGDGTWGKLGDGLEQGATTPQMVRALKRSAKH